MRYTKMVNETAAFQVTSKSRTISVNITERHPEFTLEDNSMLILPDIDTYYELIGDPQVYFPLDKDIDLGMLLQDLKDSDVVEGFSHGSEDVQVIHRIEYKGRDIYYLQRTGLNPISNKEN